MFPIDLDLLRATIDILPAYVAYVDKDLRYLLANQMYMDRFGQPEQKIVGQLVKDVTGAAFPQVERFLRGALDGRVQNLEPRMISVHGDRTLRVTHLPHRDATGQVAGVVVFGYDITEQRRAEVALIQSEKLAAAGRLASSIAHEINNPLESVTNLLYLIDTTLEKDVEQARGYARLAQQELARVAQITTQTLRFFRQSTARRSVDCAELLNAVLALYAGRLVHSNVLVERRFRSEVPHVCFDGELRQVIANLIGNALDAMRMTGGRLKLRVRRCGNLRDGQRGICLTVADTGAGMTPSVLMRAFEPFFTTKDISNTGLGLWITRSLIEKEAGRIHVRSREGRGTVFAVFLPDPAYP